MKYHYKVLRFVLTFVLFQSYLVLAGTTGKISGVVVDAEYGEGMIGANVFLENTVLGASTDLDGQYVINNVPVGSYTLIVSIVGYAELRIKDVIVKADENTVVNASVQPEVLTTEVVEVEARALHNTEASLLKSRQKSVAMSDAISAEAISQSGAGNAAEALKQITGASLVGGKYVYVRGLGDRYTSTQLNGAELPSTDPYRRSGSVDLIPSSMVDNIVTVKSFTPDKPGNFTGGTVDIKTKDYPDHFQLKVSGSATYNSAAHNNPATLGYQGSSTDWLGYDDGLRALPAYLRDGSRTIPDVGTANKDPEQAELLTKITRSFNSQMAPVAQSAPLNQSYSLSVGNQFQVFDRPLGILASMMYKNGFSSYNDGIYRRWNQGTQEAMTNVFDYKDTNSKAEVQLGGLFKASMNVTPNNKLTFNAMYNRNAISGARQLRGIYTYDADANSTQTTSVLSYNERALYTLQMEGEHVMPSLGALKMNWRTSLGNSKEAEPDRRVFSYYSINDEGETLYGIKDNLPPKRYYRNLNEDRKEAKVDFMLPFRQWNGLSSKVKFGGMVAQKQRGYNERLFSFSDLQGFDFDGNPNHLLADDQTGLLGYDTVNIRGNQFVTPQWGVVVEEIVLPANNYTAEQNISAGYAMIELPLFHDLRIIGGARLESTDMWLQTQDSTLEKGRINTNDILPSFNIIYNIMENMNLRMAYSKTLARPNFREIGLFATYDFDNGGDAFIGNPQLQRSLIFNYDLRWEWFSRPGELYAVSLFYKDFLKPIERVFNNFGENTWKNIDQARAYGVEVELRKRLDVIHPVLSNFMLSSNFSLIKSRVSISESELELIHNLRPNAPSTRPFQGQSPYLVNINLSYDNFENGLSAGLYYNVFGERLDRVSYGGTPDVYEKPSTTLNFSLGWNFMEHFGFKFNVNNILNSKHTKYQKFKDQEYIYSQFQRGRSISMGISYQY